MTTDLHALITEMAAELDHCQQLLRDDRRQRHPLADRARALLAEPQGTDGEVPRIGHILRLAEIIREVDGNHDKGAAALAEAILSHPGIRLAGLTAPPAEGEVAELVEWLHRRAAEVQAENCTTIYSAHCLTRAADLLERFASPACLVIDPGEEALASRMTARIVGPGRIKAMPAYMQIIEPAEHTLLVPVAQPMPVSERLPGPEDVDEDGNCWLWDKYNRIWDFIYIRTGTRAEMYNYTHWLPAHALPVPADD